MAAFAGFCHDVTMKSSFDDPALLAAMQAFIAATTALDAATDESQVLELSSAKSMAGMTLRKRFDELGWVAPSQLRVGS